MHDDKTKKTHPPRDPLDTQEVEYHLLGCLIYRDGFYESVASSLRAEYFQYDVHRKIYEAIESRAKAGLPLNPYALAQSLPDEPVCDDGPRLRQYILESARCITLVRTVGQIEVMRNAYLIHRAEAATRHLARTGEGQTPHVALQSYFSEVDEIRHETEQSTKKPSRSLGDAAESLVWDLSDRIAGRTQGHRVHTGLFALDNLTGGFGGGDLVIVAGRPGMGKSLLATSIARGAALNEHHVLFFSFEMTEKQITARMVAEDIVANGIGELPFRVILNHKALPDKEWDDWFEHRIGDAKQRVAKLPIEIDSNEGLTVHEITARAKKYKQKLQAAGKDLGIIVLDYLQFIKAGDRYKGNRVQEVGEISAALKGLAKELNVPIILLCQINREVEKRNKKEPQLADLRESGNLEQDADMVIFVYRPHYYDKDNDATKHSLFALVEKNRNGPCGKAHLYVNLECSYIRDRKHSDN